MLLTTSTSTLTRCLFRHRKCIDHLVYVCMMHACNCKLNAKEHAWLEQVHDEALLRTEEGGAVDNVHIHTHILFHLAIYCAWPMHHNSWPPEACLA